MSKILDFKRKYTLYYNFRITLREAKEVGGPFSLATKN